MKYLWYILEYITYNFWQGDSAIRHRAVPTEHTGTYSHVEDQNLETTVTNNKVKLYFINSHRKQFCSVSGNTGIFESLNELKNKIFKQFWK